MEFLHDDRVKPIKPALLIPAVIALVLAGCVAPASAPTPTPAPTFEPTMAQTTGPTDGMAPTGSPPPAAATPGTTAAPPATGTPSATDAPQGPVFDQPWAVAALTDVTTGEQFRIADLAAEGKVVFVETMAIWCSSCRAQQRTAVSAMEQLDPTRVAWVVIDVETSESADALARYREQNGFPFTYAIADRDLALALATQFGDVVLNPPAVNVIVLGTDGRVTHMFGQHDADELVSIANEHGA